jgi:hypothetical protein
LIFFRLKSLPELLLPAINIIGVAVVAHCEIPK